MSTPEGQVPTHSHEHCRCLHVFVRSVDLLLGVFIPFRVTGGDPPLNESPAQLQLRVQYLAQGLPGRDLKVS